MARTNTGSSVCISQMLSEDHTSLRIENWIKKWLKETGVGPMEIVMDESSALILASVRAFTRYRDLDSYLHQCLCVLENKSDELPETFIRIDISHLVKTIHQNTILKTVDPRAKRFFLYSLALLFWIRDFNVVKGVFLDMLTLFTNQFDKMENIDLPAELSRQRLQQLIRTHSTAEVDYQLDQQKDSMDEIDEIEDDSDNDTDLVNDTWFTKMERNLVLDDGDKPNIYYFEGAGIILKKYAKRLPLFSAVMAEKFSSNDNVVSSSNVESEFRYVKRDLFANRKYMRADTFLFEHSLDLLGSMKLANANYNKSGKKNFIIRYYYAATICTYMFIKLTRLTYILYINLASSAWTG